MKRKFSRILGAGLAIAFLASFAVAAPLAADISQPAVDVDDEEISAVSEYSITFNVNDELAVDYDLATLIDYPDGSAAWTTTRANSGIYSVLLDAGTAGGATSGGRRDPT